MSFDIVDYTEKSIAVFGDVQKFESEFIKLNGMYNEKLKYQGGIGTGFIFPKFKRPQVMELVRKLKISESIGGNLSESKVSSSSMSSSSKIESREDNVVLSREQFMNLVSTLNRLEQDVAHLKKQMLSVGDSTKSNPLDKIITKKVEKKAEKEENPESSDDDYNDDYNNDEEFEIPKTKGPSLLKSKNEKEKKGPSLLKR